MNEMIERVARASFKYWRENCDRLGVHMEKAREFDSMPEGERAFALGHAAAIVAAMRNPTPDMHQAGMLKREEGTIIAGASWGEPTTDEIWRAMIDAALK